MTRFARAKGSKSSNEKLPEPATSWSEMKQGLLDKNKELDDKKRREEFMKKRQASYKAFLQEKEEEVHKNVIWADFPQANGVGKKPATVQNNANDKKPKMSLESDSNESDNEEYVALKAQIDKVLDKQEHNQGSSSNIIESESDNEPPEVAGTKEEPKEVVVKKVKKQKLQLIINNEAASKKLLSEREQRLIQKKQKRFQKQSEKKKRLKKELKVQGNGKIEAESDEQQVGESDPNINLQIEKKLERRKKQKEKKKLKHKTDVIIKTEENLDEEALKKVQKKKEKQIRQLEKRRKARQDKAALKNNNTPKGFAPNNQTDTISENGEEKKPFQNKQPGKNVQQQQQKKQGKPRDHKEHHRKKLKAETLFINGKNVEIDYVDGFPVKKEDADRLRNLRKEMISKGLPRSEINASLKLERRRAEKAFAREKKNVCFKCRKSGHNLSECPELNKDQVTHTTGTGICFKCGSTEHTHFECKVVRGMEYKFASCFICKEQGHIAKQCPDNQRGLYPKGGACKVCGDVTHLKKDCPKFQTQQMQLQSNLNIGTMDNGNPDDMVVSQGKKLASQTVKVPNKIIKF